MAALTVCDTVRITRQDHIIYAPHVAEAFDNNRNNSWWDNMLFNDDWLFARLETGSDYEAVRHLPEHAWQAVCIPHDWLISKEKDLYQDSDGWYRKSLEVTQDLDKWRWILTFDGVYQDCEVWANGNLAAVHRYGYTAFDIDLTSLLRPGINELMVHVRYQAPNSRWYTGAGIYRDMSLQILPQRHVVPEGIYISTHRMEDDCWKVTADISLEGAGCADKVVVCLRDPDDRVLKQEIIEDDGDLIHAQMIADSPKLWSCDTPNLYCLSVEIPNQIVRQHLGFRETAFDPDHGFFLNGMHVKLHGVCLHHDLGALGSAFREAAFRRQLGLMKSMGANALRTSHNPPAKRALDVCDEMGILVIDELYDTWELSKTQYDHSRFFPECWQQDVREWVLRDRNHPCVIMWSIGNEILDTHLSERGAVLTRRLMNEVRRWDPRENARVTLGSNYMPWPNAQNCADIVGIPGYNYGEKYYQTHHAEHKNWVIYGSETASILSSRGVYHFPADTPVLSEEDMQCSSLGNSMTSWGTQDLRRCLIDDINTPCSMGQFLWSGIDYIGEPTPYHTRSCYFGMADTACFPKDFYYQVKAVWNREPMVHIGVNWDWNDGQMIDVPVYTNGAQCELYLNDISLGAQDVDLSVPEMSVPVWHIPFSPGVLRAIARDVQGNVIAVAVRQSHGDSARLVLSCDRTALHADGEDMAFVTLSAVDDKGRTVENAADRVRVEVEGPIQLLGLDNGDSADSDGYKVTERNLFSGKLLIMLGTKNNAGQAKVRVESDGLIGAELTLSVSEGHPKKGQSRVFDEKLHAPEPACTNPVRRIDITLREGRRILTPENPEAIFNAELLPATADPQPIAWKIVNARGIESSCAQVQTIKGGVCVTGRGDGRVYLRATCCNGYAHPRVLSQTEIEVSGFGSACLDPYGFISAGLYDIHSGDITPGNEKGISFSRDSQSMAGFTNVDFGTVGSDVITLPVFALNDDDYDIELWLGLPGDGGHRVDVLHYQKPCKWNVYQSQTWHLPERITGVQTLCFLLNKKIHLKGFSFERQSRAWLRLNASDADALYGDSYIQDGDNVRGIGNNVTICFSNMDFGDRRVAALRLWGHTSLPVNPVQVRITNTLGECVTQECAFTGSADEQCFEVTTPGGLCEVALVFMPGSRFDLYALEFERESREGQNA